MSRAKRKIPQTLFEHQVYCGVCGAKELRTSLYPHSSERAYQCPVCKEKPELEFRYPLCELVWEAETAIRKERRMALRTGQKVLQTERWSIVEQYYHEKMDAVMKKIQENTRQINELFLQAPLDEPFSVATKKQYAALQRNADDLTARLAGYADTLVNFLSNFTLENEWYVLYSSIPEKFAITPEFSRTTIHRIILTPGKPPEFEFMKLDKKQDLMDCLHLIDKAEKCLAIREVRKNAK